MNWKTSKPPRDKVILVRAVAPGFPDPETIFAVTRISDSTWPDGVNRSSHSVEGSWGRDSVNDFTVEQITHWCEIVKPEGVA
jgi:hypothetical protein